MGQAQSQGQGSQIGRGKDLTTIGRATVTGGSGNSRWQRIHPRIQESRERATTLSVAAEKWGQSGVAMQAETMTVETKETEKHNPGPERNG